MKSSINQAVLVTDSLELAGLEGEGKILWAQEVFTLLDVALVPPGEDNFSTREGTHHWAGSLTAWSHNRERKTCRAPWREGGTPGKWASMPLAVLHQGLLLLVSQHTHWAVLALTLPRSLSCLGNSPGPSNSSRLSGDHAQGKTRPPPSKHIQLPM